MALSERATTIPPEIYAELYYGVAVVMGDEGEFLITHDLRRAQAAHNRFIREVCDEHPRDYWDGRPPEAVRMWLRVVTDGPDRGWVYTTTEDDPEAVPAIYIGD